jgi:DnaJ-class molecular chaperone
MTDKKTLENAFEDLEFEDDDYEACSWCGGCGEGMYDGAACRKCHGSGVEPVEKKDSEYE